MISVNLMFSFTFMRFVIHLSENDHLFSSFVHFVKTDQERWSSWNSFIRIEISFFIIVYDSHVLYLYFSHLIRSSNCASWVCHLMSSIKSTKYESSSLSTIMSSDSDTCYSTELCFENSNKLMWNVECIFISSDKSSSYA